MTTGMGTVRSAESSANDGASARWRVGSMAGVEPESLAIRSATVTPWV